MDSLVCCVRIHDLRHARQPPCFGWWLPGLQIASIPTYLVPVRATRPFSPQTSRTANRPCYAFTHANHPPAVSSMRPYLNGNHTPCPERAHTRKPPQCRAQHAPALQCRAQHAPASALLRCPARQYARGSFPRSWTSGLPGTTPPQLKCSPHSSTAPSLPTPGLHPPGG